MPKESDVSQLRTWPILFIMGCLTAAIWWLSQSAALEHYNFYPETGRLADPR